VLEVCWAFSLIFVGNDPSFTGGGGGAELQHVPAALHHWMQRIISKRLVNVSKCNLTQYFTEKLRKIMSKEPNDGR